MRHFIHIVGLLWVLLGLVWTAPVFSATPKAASHESEFLRPWAAVELESEHFHFFARESQRRQLEKLAAEADERFVTLCRALSACDRMDGKIELWVASEPSDFASFFPEGSPVGEWAAGVAFTEQNRIVIRAHGSAVFSFLEIFDHEVAHLLHRSFDPGRQMPRWFTEGLAIWQSGEPLLRRFEEGLKASAQSRFFDLDELSKAFPREGRDVSVAYAQSALFVRYLIQHHGAEQVILVLHDLAAGLDFNSSFVARLGSSPDFLMEEFLERFGRGGTWSQLVSQEAIWIWMSLLFLFVAWRVRKERKEAWKKLAEKEAAFSYPENWIILNDSALIGSVFSFGKAPRNEMPQRSGTGSEE